MERPGRALGVDFGERRIGLAVADADGRVATPLTVVPRTSDRAAIAAILEVVRREGIAVVVAGEPVGLGGERGAAAERARGFAARLARAARLPLVVVGEALTSVEAERRLRGAGAARRAPVDAVAAQILLQEALDRGLVAAAAVAEP